jgi:4-hydroxy-tetrahydrodipicolinate synthase
MDGGAGLTGVFNILTTPFLPDGALDLVSLRGLTEAVVGAGVDGVTVLGVAGEAQKLSVGERERVVATVLEVAAGRVPVFVGASQEGTDTTIAASRAAERTGAAGVMIAPPAFLAPGPALTEHLRRVGDAIGVPIVLQDFPPVNGVTMSPAAMAALVEAVPAITTIKLEGTPTPQRTAQTLALVGGRATVLGGLGGVYLLDELRRGASGTMTGFAYPEVLVEVWRAWRSGDRRGAAGAYARALPLLVFEGQPGVGLAIRKAILRRRGLIAHAGVRHPGPRVDQGILDDLEETLSLLDVERRFDARPEPRPA